LFPDRNLLPNDLVTENSAQWVVELQSPSLPKDLQQLSSHHWSTNFAMPRLLARGISIDQAIATGIPSAEAPPIAVYINSDP
tara:strand:- start:630 stop:875 length:246 start_codon:yes stop_codon:yes gene_type:complete